MNRWLMIRRFCRGALVALGFCALTGGALAQVPEVEKPVPEPILPMPEPVKPMPKPVKPMPEPVTPVDDQAKPEPIKPKPEPIKPKPEPIKPEPIKPEPEPIKPIGEKKEEEEKPSPLEIIRKDLDPQEKQELLQRNVQRIQNPQNQVADRVKWSVLASQILADDEDLKATPAAQAAVGAIVSFLEELRTGTQADMPHVIDSLAQLATALGDIGQPDAAPGIPSLISLVEYNVGRPVDCKEAGIFALIPPSPYHPLPALSNRYGLGGKYRMAAAVALGKLKAVEAIPALTRVVVVDPYPGVNAYQEAIYQDMNWPVRAAAATALGEIGQPIVVPDLATAAGTDRKQEVRDAALEAIGVFKKAAKDEPEKLPLPKKG